MFCTFIYVQHSLSAGAIGQLRSYLTMADRGGSSPVIYSQAVARFAQSHWWLLLVNTEPLIIYECRTIIFSNEQLKLNSQYLFHKQSIIETLHNMTNKLQILV